ncbi:Psoralen synthase [Handroanthus impetiginosus]|uniref:Psoralen synthase n=1 Tax=Handroanthus impetiginosus TaxID=429701 RepID=A0A2G9HN93_9LAMI|nr:Psoralen synthase [Handroanthus impetiginosus]
MTYVNLMGYDIEPETMVLINAWAVGWDPAYWSEPEKFMPERFLDSSVDFRGFDFQLMGGRRVCPGLGFGVSSIEHIVANLMHKFDWALPDGAKGEELDMMERPGFSIARKNPLIVVATQCYIC